MKLLQKIGSMLVRPPGKRGLSRVDLIVFLALGVIIVIDLIFHTLQPSSPAAVASPVKLASMQGVATTTQADLPDTHLSPASSSAASDSPYSFPSCYTANGGGIGALPAAPNTIKGPFGSGNDLLFFVTCPGLTTESNSIPTPTLWTWVLVIVNASVFILFVLTGLRIMLGGSIFRYANAIEVLPSILLALLAANLSLSIITMSLQLNNDLVVQVYNQANNLAPTTAQYVDGNDIVTKTCNNWWTAGGAAVGGTIGTAIPIPVVGSILGGIVGGFVGHTIGCDVDPHVTNWNDGLNNSLDPNNVTGGASLTGLSLLFKSMTNLLEFVTGTLALMLMGQMVVRLLLLNFYIILAPLGIGAWALPGRTGQSLTRMWLQGFFATLFSQFLQVVGLIVIRLLIGAITSGIYASFNNSAVNNDATLLWVIQIAQYWFLIRIPTLLGASATNMVVSFGQQMGQLTQTAVMMTAMEVQFVSSVAMSAIGSAASLGAMAIAR